MRIQSLAVCTMTLLFTVFLLVFVTELVSWIGQSVLLESVRWIKEKVSLLTLFRLMHCIFEFSTRRWP